MSKETYKLLEDQNLKDAAIAEKLKVEVAVTEERKEVITLARVNQELISLTSQKEQIEESIKLWQERKKKIQEMLKGK